MQGNWAPQAVFEQEAPQARFKAEQQLPGNVYTLTLLDKRDLHQKIVQRPGDYSSKVMVIRLTADRNHLEIESDGEVERTEHGGFRLRKPLKIVIT